MSGYSDDEDYTPATRPANAPGGDRVRFEREGEHEQFLGGGGAQEIEASVMRSTERNLQLFGWTIIAVTDVVGELGAGTMQSFTLHLERGGVKKSLKINGIALEVEVI